jgi:TonB family protein
MFEEYSKPRGRERRLSAAQTVAILVSAAFHVLFVYGLYHGKITIRMIPAFTEVRNVVIGPSQKGPGPVVMGSSTSEAPEAAPGASSRTGGAEARTDAVPGATSGVPAAPAPGLSRAFSLRREPDGTPVAALSEEFYESLLSRVRPRTKSGLIITFSPPGVRPVPPPNADLREHLFPGQPGLPEESDASRARRAGPGGQRAGITIPLEGYDLTPWAEQVIALIQKNWDLPLVRDLPPKASVRILTMITKSGSLSSFELLISSSLAPLDRAAVRAIRTSLPFPPLPADFPADLLEAYFEFTYNE